MKCGQWRRRNTFVESRRYGDWYLAYVRLVQLGRGTRALGMSPMGRGAPEAQPLWEPSGGSGGSRAPWVPDGPISSWAGAWAPAAVRAHVLSQVSAQARRARQAWRPSGLSASLFFLPRSGHCCVQLLRKQLRTVTCTICWASSFRCNAQLDTRAVSLTRWQQ